MRQINTLAMLLVLMVCAFGDPCRSWAQESKFERDLGAYTRDESGAKNLKASVERLKYRAALDKIVAAFAIADKAFDVEQFSQAANIYFTISETATAKKYPGVKARALFGAARANLALVSKNKKFDPQTANSALSALAKASAVILAASNSASSSTSLDSLFPVESIDDFFEDVNELIFSLQSDKLTPSICEAAIFPLMSFTEAPPLYCLQSTSNETAIALDEQMIASDLTLTGSDANDLQMYRPLIVSLFGSVSHARIHDQSDRKPSGGQPSAPHSPAAPTHKSEDFPACEKPPCPKLHYHVGVFQDYPVCDGFCSKLPAKRDPKCSQSGHPAELSCPLTKSECLEFDDSKIANSAAKAVAFIEKKGFQCVSDLFNYCDSVPTVPTGLVRVGGQKPNPGKGNGTLEKGELQSCALEVLGDRSCISGGGQFTLDSLLNLMPDQLHINADDVKIGGGVFCGRMFDTFPAVAGGDGADVTKIRSEYPDCLENVMKPIASLCLFFTQDCPTPTPTATATPSPTATVTASPSATETSQTPPAGTAEPTATATASNTTGTEPPSTPIPTAASVPTNSDNGGQNSSGSFGEFSSSGK